MRIFCISGLNRTGDIVIMESKEKLIVAVDTDSYEKAVEIIDSLEDSVDIFKVGLENYIATNGKTVDYLIKKGKKVFLDLKFHDIPNTMKSAVGAAIRDGIWMMTIHASDYEGMKACAEVAREKSEKLGIKKPILVAVTVLTSLSNEDLEDIGCVGDTSEIAIKRALLAKKAGVDGVVCSAKEVSDIVNACGKDFVTVCPGIRPSNSASSDQKRVVTPSDAIKNGASVLVVGRPITQSDNPSEMAVKILDEIDSVL